LAGAALAGASIFSIAVMAHHPSGTGHGALGQVVHGTMIAIVLVALAGYIRLAVRRGLHRFLNLAALVAYTAGAGANMLAAAINGFVVARVVADGAGQDILRLCWEINQALAYGAVYATSFAFLIWGGDLVREAGARWLTGVAGLAAAIAPTALLMAGALDMNVAGAFIVYALQAAFGVLAGAELMRSGAGARRHG
jgi:hypothetical protein